MKDKKKPSRFETLRKERRYWFVMVDIGIVGNMFLNSDYEYSFEGLPKDALFVHADRDIQHQAFTFVYLHESFDSVIEGTTPEYKFLTVKTKPKEATHKAELAALHSKGEERT